MSSGNRKKASRANRFGMMVIGTIVVILIIVILARCHALKVKINAYAQENEALTEQIEDEKGRAEEIKNLPEYIQSDEYIEKVAREKFGLVYSDETIFKSSKDK